MNILKATLLCCLLFASITGAYAQSVTPPKLLVMVYGNSLTSNINLPAEQRFTVQLERKLKTIGFEVDVVPVSSEELTLSMILQKLDIILGKSPDLVILQLGDYDIKRRTSSKNFGINLNKIIDSLKEKGIYVVVMGTKVLDLTDIKYATEIDKIFKKIGEKTSLYPYTLEGIVGHPELTTSDGYHPNAHGARVMVDGIYRIIDTGLRWRLEVINKWRSQPQARPVSLP